MRKLRGASPRKKMSRPAAKSGSARAGKAPARASTSKRSEAAREVAAIKKSFAKRYGFTPRISGGEIVLTRGEQSKITAVKRAVVRHREQKKYALAAREAFKPRKNERGRIVMIGQHGQHNPQGKGKKGYAAYITKTGKVRLLKSGYKSDPYKARKLRDIELPLRRNLHKRVEAFKLATVGRGRTIKPAARTLAAVKRGIKQNRLTGDSAGIYGDFKLSSPGKGRGRVTTGGAHDFNKGAVKKIAAHLRKVIKAQRGQRTFNIEVIGIIELPDKTREVIQFTVGIARNDSDAIKLAGVENFVRQKFYAHLAQQLSFMGFVTRGSANHIRALADNQGLPREEWTDKRGEAWAGADLEIVNLISLEWRITQAK